MHNDTIKVGDIFTIRKTQIRKEKTLKGYNLYVIIKGYRVFLWRNTLEIADGLEELEIRIIKEIDMGYQKIFVANLNIKH